MLSEEKIKINNITTRRIVEDVLDVGIQEERPQKAKT
jgi:hypothetical protein